MFLPDLSVVIIISYGELDEIVAFLAVRAIWTWIYFLMLGTFLVVELDDANLWRIFDHTILVC